ncbi:MAG TPA: diguanylate cyclase, partial [Pseudonocardiaceae bacterium]|nr:diguanylate cyclase [Pseudonocardiaceae bacterium]
MAPFRALGRVVVDIRGWGRSTIVLYGSFGVSLVAFPLTALVNTDLTRAVAGSFMQLFEIVALVLGVRVSRHPRLDQRTRRGWRIVAMSFALLAISGVLFIVGGPNLAVPSAADAFRLAFVPVLLTGLLSLPLRLTSTNDRYRLILDIGTVVAGSFMVLWYTSLGPALSAHGALVAPLAVAVAYPIGDLVLVFGATTVLLRGTATSVRRPSCILATAAGLLVVGDLGVTHVWKRSQEQTWPFLFWMSAVFLMAAAAHEQHRQAHRHRLDRNGETTDHTPRPVTTLPYLAIALGYSLLLVRAVRENLYPWGGLVAGAFVITGLVVTRQILVLRKNHELVATDSLTGLANRVRLRENLQRAMARAQRSGRHVAVLLVDMDGFKQINDTLGHDAGDSMLVAFGHLLTHSVPTTDCTIGRLGGDEFAIVLNDIDGYDAAVAVARHIVAGMTRPMTVLDRQMVAHASIGIALSHADSDQPSELLRRADMAMYLAKRHNTGSWRLYADAQPEPAGGTPCRLEEDLRLALRDGQLGLRYQPIVTLGSGQLVGLEALVRWEHPEHGQIPPQTFVTVAEQTGLITQLGNWVLQRSCRQVRAWQRDLPAGQRLQLNVNISPHQLTERGSLVEDVLTTLRHTDFDPRDLTLEITEGA